VRSGCLLRRTFPSVFSLNPVNGEEAMSIDNPETEFTVVMNDQEQYSIWPTYRPVPAGWQAVGVTGNKSECLEHINQTWTDQRPRRLRDAQAS
jgi:MbtH protein